MVDSQNASAKEVRVWANGGKLCRRAVGVIPVLKDKLKAFHRSRCPTNCASVSSVHPNPLACNSNRCGTLGIRFTTLSHGMLKAPPTSRASNNDWYCPRRSHAREVMRRQFFRLSARRFRQVGKSVDNNSSVRPRTPVKSKTARCGPKSAARNCSSVSSPITQLCNDSDPKASTGTGDGIGSDGDCCRLGRLVGGALVVLVVALGNGKGGGSFSNAGSPPERLF